MNARFPCPRFFAVLSGLCLALFLACGGGGSSSGSGTTPTPPNNPNAPTITSFTAAKSPITSGTSTALTAVFSGGTGSVDHGVGTVTSGTAVTVSPTANTTYTLTVTNGAGSPTRTADVLVVAAPVKPVITVTGSILAGQTGLTASVDAQTGCTYAWTISGGTLTAGDGTRSITFSTGTTGSLTLSCTVANAAGDSATSDLLSYTLGPGPSKPVIAVTSSIHIFESALASVVPQIGCSYDWTISGGGFLEVGNAASARFTSDAPGTVTLTCTVTDANQVAVASDPAHVTVVDAPVKPVIVVPAFVNSNLTGITASVENQAGCTFAWTITGGAITAGAGTASITLTSGGPGTMTLSCTATKNSISVPSDPVRVQVLDGGANSWETPLSESSLPPLQVNISSDGSRQWIFANMLRTSEAWISVPGATAAEAQNLANQVEVDASGWPTSFPAGAGMRMAVGYQTGEGTYLYGVYVLTWEGSGNVELQSTQNDGLNEETLLNDQTGGRIVKLIKTPTKGAIVFVNTSDPSNPVRNMKLWAPASDGAGLSLTSTSNLTPGHVTGSLEPAPGVPEPMWHPRFLQHLAEAENYGVFRFMGWMNICQDVWDRDTLEWSDRSDPSYAFSVLNTIDGSYNRYPVNAFKHRLGMPYEWMIDLCNATGKDLWIQVPHVASEDLIRKLADLCATRLNSNLRVWFEYSNEIWNGINPYLAQQNKARAVAALHFDVPYADVTFDQIAWGSGHLQGLALKTFEDEWRAKGMTDDRLINVVASFVGSSTFSQGALDAVKEIDPDLPEVLAVTNYFGYGTQYDIFALHDFGADPGVWPADLYDKTAVIVRRNLYGTIDSWKASADVAKGSGVPLVAYEGGQHLLPMGLGDWNNPAHSDFMTYMYDFQRSQQIKDLYLEHYALWNAMGGRTASLFVDTSGWAFWGYWGAKEYMVQTRAESKKWDAFATWGDLEAGVRAPSDPLGSRPVLPELNLKGEAQLAYSQDISAVGGDGTVEVAIVGGSLPPGLTFTEPSTGVGRISGTPTVDGVYRFVLRALDADMDPDYKAYTISIDPQGVTANAIVVFRGQDIPATIPNYDWIARYNPARDYTEVRDGSNVLTRLYIPFSMANGQALFNQEGLEVPGTPNVIPATSPLNMYGGWSVAADGTATGTREIGTFTGLRDYQWCSWTGDPGGNPTVLDALLLWRADQFNAMGGSGAYAFGSDAATALLRLDMTGLIDDGDNEIRFVVLDGGTTYISEAAFTSPYLGDGYFQLSGFSGSSTAGQRWSIFTPTADAYAIPAAGTLSFISHTFSNVQAVGIAYHGRRWGYNYMFSFSRFLALGRRQ